MTTLLLLLLLLGKTREDTVRDSVPVDSFHSPPPSLTASLTGSMLFSALCGENVRLSEDKMVARRVKSYSKAITLSSTPLPSNRIFQVHIQLSSIQYINE